MKIRKTSLLIILIILIVSIVQSVDFYQSGPWLGDVLKNSLETIRTSENIYCRWNATPDTTNARYVWYVNGQLWANTDYNNKTITYPGSEIAIVDKIFLSEDETWNCTVTIYNATASKTASDTIYIDYDPLVYINAGGYVKINRTYTLYEDQSYSILWNTTATDAISNSFSETTDMCTTTSSGYGQGTCNPTNDYLGADKNISEELQVSFKYDHPRGTQKNNINFTIMPVNDAPVINVTSITNNVINQTDELILQINVTDEEGNPVNPGDFQVLSAPSIDSFCSYTPIVNQITINCTPGPLNIGNFSVNITATDTPPVNGFNLTAENSTETINIEILRVNHIPIITYVSNTNSSQGENLVITMNATDQYDNNTLNFSITSNCNITNPWTNVNTTTTVNGTGANVTSYAFGIWNDTLTNNNIICRNVSVIITDEFGATNSTNIYLNISNVNDPPFIENYSINTGDILNNHYIYNLTAYQLTSFTYQINITDPDTLVTNPLGIDSFDEVLNVTTNNSWINQYLNTSTGLINISNVNQTVGNYSILVNLTDSQNISNTTIMNIEINPNSAPEFNQTLNFTCYEYDSINYNQSCNINLSNYASDPDEGIGDRVANFSEDSDIFNVTNEGLLLLNITQAMVGEYTFNVTIKDLRGTSYTQEMYLYVNNTNNKPNISSIEVRIPSKALYYNKSEFNIIPISASDLDESLDVFNDTSNPRYNYEHLTFNWTNNNQSQNITGYISINQTSRELIINTTKVYNSQIIPIGDYSINVTVKDNYYNFTNITTQDTDTYTYNFSIYNTTTPPDITAIYPYGDANKTTVFAWQNINDSDNITYINVTENNSIFFNHTSTTDNNNTPTYKWYYDDSLITSGSTINHNSTATMSNGNKSITYSFGFFEVESLSTKLHNLTLVVIDGYDQSETDQFTWNINVSDLNRPPVWNENIENISMSGSRTYRDVDLFECDDTKGYYDPDFDYDGDGTIECDEGSFILTYHFYNNTGSTDDQVSICGGYADIDVTSPYYNVTNLTSNTSQILGHGINADPVENGTCSVIFNATDGEYYVLSNPIYFTISVPDDTESPTQVISKSGTRTVTETVTIRIPIPRNIEKPKYLEIIMPDMVTVYEDNRIEVPLTLVNNWNKTIYGINLSYEINDSEKFNISFLRDNFYKIDPGEEIKTAMVVEGYRVGGIYEINVVANVTNPEYQDKAKIYLNSIEQSSKGAKIRTLVTFANDLLSKNKECQELEEILKKAQEEVDKNNYDKALELLDSMINGCKYLISKEQKKESPKSIRNIHLNIKQEYLTYLAIAAALLALGAGTFMLFRKKKEV